MNAYTVFWIAWVVVALIVETVALLNTQVDDTLSENVWRWMQWKFFAWFLAFFLIWLTVHFFTRGKWA